MATRNSNERTVISRIKKMFGNSAKFVPGHNKKQHSGDNGSDGDRSRGLDDKTEIKNIGGYGYPFVSHTEMEYEGQNADSIGRLVYMPTSNSNEQAVISNSHKPASKTGGGIKKQFRNLGKFVTCHHQNHHLGRSRDLDHKTDFKNTGRHNYPFVSRTEMKDES